MSVISNETHEITNFYEAAAKEHYHIVKKEISQSSNPPIWRVKMRLFRDNVDQGSTIQTAASKQAATLKCVHALRPCLVPRRQFVADAAKKVRPVTASAPVQVKGSFDDQELREAKNRIEKLVKKLSHRDALIAELEERIDRLEQAPKHSNCVPRPVYKDLEDKYAASQFSLSAWKLQATRSQVPYELRYNTGSFVYVYRHSGEGNLELVNIEPNPGPATDYTYRHCSVCDKNTNFLGSECQRCKYIGTGLRYDDRDMPTPVSTPKQLHEPGDYEGYMARLQRTVASASASSHEEYMQRLRNRVEHARNGNVDPNQPSSHVLGKDDGYVADDGDDFNCMVDDIVAEIDHVPEVDEWDCPDCGGIMLSIDDEFFHKLPACQSAVSQTEADAHNARMHTLNGNDLGKRPSLRKQLIEDGLSDSAARCVVQMLDPFNDRKKLPSRQDAVRQTDAEAHNALMHATNGNNKKAGGVKPVPKAKLPAANRRTRKNIAKAGKQLRTLRRPVYTGGKVLPRQVRLTIETATMQLREKGFTENEVRFIIQMVDPFHDLKVDPGKPPSKTKGMSVVRKITGEIAFGKPAGLSAGATWSAHIVNMPLVVDNQDLFNTSTAAATVLQDEKPAPSFNGQFTGVDASGVSPTTYLGGKDRQCEGVTIRTFPSAQSASPYISAAAASTYTNQFFVPYVNAPGQGNGSGVIPLGSHRLCGVGYEIIDMTPKLYAGGGSIGTYMQSPAKQDLLMYNDAPTPDRSILATGFRAPPTVPEAKNLPSWQTWESNKGAYVVCTPASDQIDPVAWGSKNVIMMGGDVGTAGSSLYYSIPTLKNGINGGGNLYAGESVTPIAYHDWNYHGCILEGLNENAVFKMRQIVYVEQFVNSSNQALVTLTTQTARDNPYVWQTIKRMLSDKPAAVQLNQNYSGEWFVNCVESISRHGGTIASWLGAPPMVAATLAAVNKAARAIDKRFK